MRLDTLNIENLYNSLAKVLNVEKRDLQKCIISHHREIIDSRFEDSNIEDLNLIDLLSISDNSKINIIDEVIVHHITPRPNKDSIEKEGLLPLPLALTENTLLSKYLKKFGFTFCFDGAKIVFKKDNKLVDVSRLAYSNLAMRLGGDGTTNDFNINGYLFVDSFECDLICGWLGSPEFLKSLSCAFNNRHIADDYAENAFNYYVSFSVPAEKIDITGFGANIDANRKTNILIKYAINALAYSEAKYTPFFSMHNPIIMLKRDYQVPPKDVLKIWEMDFSKYPKIFPVS